MSVYIRRFSELPYRESNSSGQGVPIRIISGNRETITASCKLSKSQVRVDRRTLNINGIGVRINGLGLNYRTGRVDDLSGNAFDHVSIAHANNYSMAEALLTSRLIFHKMPKTIGIILLDFFCDTWYK